jgi:hypothetical protein
MQILATLFALGGILTARDKSEMAFRISVYLMLGAIWLRG